MADIPSSIIQPINPPTIAGPDPNAPQYSQTPALDALQDAYHKGVVGVSDILSLAQQGSDLTKNVAVNKADVQAAKLRLQTQPGAAALLQGQTKLAQTALTPEQAEANLQAGFAAQDPTGQIANLWNTYKHYFGAMPPPKTHTGAIDFNKISRSLYGIGVDPSTGKPHTNANPAPAGTQIGAAGLNNTIADEDIGSTLSTTGQPNANPEIRPAAQAQAGTESAPGGSEEMTRQTPFEASTGIYSNWDSKPWAFRIQLASDYYQSPAGKATMALADQKGLSGLLYDTQGLPRNPLVASYEISHAPEQLKGQDALDAESDYNNSVNRMIRLNDLRKIVNEPGIVGKGFNEGDLLGTKYAEFKRWIKQDPNAPGDPTKYSKQNQVEMAISGEKSHWMATNKNVRNLFEFNALTGQAPRMDSDVNVWNKYIDEQQTALVNDTRKLRSHLINSDLPDVPTSTAAPSVKQADGLSRETALPVSSRAGYDALPKGAYYVAPNGAIGMKQ